MPDNPFNKEEKNINKPDMATYLNEVNQKFKEQDIQEKAKLINLPYINIIETPINPDVMDTVTKEQAERGKLMPFFQSGKKLKIATCSPDNNQTKDVIKEIVNQKYEVELYLASQEGIKKAQDPYYSSKYYAKKSAKVKMDDTEISTEIEIKNLQELKEKITSVPLDEALTLIHQGALKTRASDIHIQPLSKDSAVVRFRIDGELMDIFEIPFKIYDQIIKQIKYLSHLKLNITQVPQDGQYYFEASDRQIDMRVSTLPSAFGESVVTRILDPNSTVLSFNDLGYRKNLIDIVEKNIHRSHGLILVTGPTGSGKTTSLYAMLNTLNTSDKKIITLEDPIEYHLLGITQSQINLDQEYDFRDGLKAILRHDPDIIMVGEIRDLETAQTATQASLTGHIVLSTLHTNSAIESISRLVNMGLPSFMIGPSINLIMAQRLVRKVCNCAKDKEINESARKQISPIIENLRKRGLNIPELKMIKTPQGCDKCSNTGYLGQTGIIEILDITPEIRELIINNANPKEILAKACEQGFLTMQEDGVIKILGGITTISEVWRVI